MSPVLEPFAGMDGRMIARPVRAVDLMSANPLFRPQRVRADATLNGVRALLCP
jgi:hypothetical protein